ncbi:MAG: IS1380 family transposase [Burkholderiaceae bacterium]|nr:IS1380 family transposase [Burkholderiaceae bacterium]
MGETLQPATPRFNRSLRIESRAERLTGDPGALVLREILENSGIVTWMTERLSDPRRQEDVVHDLASLIRTSVLLAAQGWRDHDDADALRDDPAFRLAVNSSAGLTPLGGPGLASQPTLSRFTAMMAEPANRSILREAVLELAGRGVRAQNAGKRLPQVTLDVDSLPIEVHGHQPKAEWNGHYNARIYHPLVTSIASRRRRAFGTTTGDMLDARLRAGNVGTADGALDVILDVVDRAQASLCEVAMVRIDAGFPSATLLAGLEARGIDYVSRLRANPALDREAAPHMKRASCRRHASGVTGRRPAAPRMWLHELRYQAETWDRERRVILVVKERADDLLLDRFFLVTSLTLARMSREDILEHYRARGTAEGHMGELKDVLAPALSSTNRPKSHWRGRTPQSCADAVDAFACNEVRLLIALLAYEVMHVARRAMAAATGTGWSLRRLRERVLRAGARLILSGRRMTLALSSAAAPFWAALWPRITALHWSGP